LQSSDSCVERVCAALGVGTVLGGTVGAMVSAFKTPSVLERADRIGVAAARASMPRVSRLVSSNAVLFGAVGMAYAGGKCLAEGIVGEKHPINSGIGGSCAGVALGIHTGSPTVLLGSMAGFFVLGIVGDVNGGKMIQDPERMKEKFFGTRKAN